ncbi:MAG: hypothetical protein ACJ0QL_04870 [Parvicellaceae bacterium]
MKNKVWIIFGLVLLSIFFGFKSKSKERTCKKGEYSYSIATYGDEIFMDKKYRLLFDSILQEPLYKYFCENEIKGLPGSDQKESKTTKSIAIEPLFIDLNNKDGLYGYRSWNVNGKNPRYYCGFHHYLFVISNNKYYPLKEDSTENIELVKSRLSSTFTIEQINRMISWGINTNYYCNNHTYDWPLLIKKDTIELWNIYKEIKNTEPNKE